MSTTSGIAIPAFGKSIFVSDMKHINALRCMTDTDTPALRSFVNLALEARTVAGTARSDDTPEVIAVLEEKVLKWSNRHTDQYLFDDARIEGATLSVNCTINLYTSTLDTFKPASAISLGSIKVLNGPSVAAYLTRDKGTEILYASFSDYERSVAIPLEFITRSSHGQDWIREARRRLIVLGALDYFE